MMKVLTMRNIDLIPVKRTHELLLKDMAIYYSQPKGFVGRNICYLVYYNNVHYGAICGGSATKFLPGRDEFFGITKQNKKEKLLEVINNIFFHIEPQNKYPMRNFTTEVVKAWRIKIQQDCQNKYGNIVIGFETLVELPRTGELYKKDKWLEVGQTKGFTCKRTKGKSTDSWSGKRVWNTNDLRPKRVFVRNV